MNIHTRICSNWHSGFREEDLKETTTYLSPLGLLFLLSTVDQLIFLEDHPTNIHTKFGSNWFCGFRKED